MKKLSIYLILAVTVCACQQNNDCDLDQNSPISSAIYLDIEENMDNTEVSNLSIEEEKIYYEAKERFGKLVEYKNEQFYLKHDNCEAISISPSLFDHFKKIMEHSNEYYNKLSNDQKEKLNSSLLKSTQPRTRTGSETVGGGIDGFSRTWCGFDVYLSNNTLLLIAGGASIASVIAGVIQDPYLISKAIAVECGIVAAVAGYTAAKCPNGIVISYTYLAVPGVGCIPYNIQKQ